MCWPAASQGLLRAIAHSGSSSRSLLPCLARALCVSLLYPVTLCNQSLETNPFPSRVPEPIRFRREYQSNSCTQAALRLSSCERCRKRAPRRRAAARWIVDGDRLRSLGSGRRLEARERPGYACGPAFARRLSRCVGSEVGCRESTDRWQRATRRWRLFGPFSSGAGTICVYSLSDNLVNYWSTHKTQLYIHTVPHRIAAPGDTQHSLTSQTRRRRYTLRRRSTHKTLCGLCAFARRPALRGDNRYVHSSQASTLRGNRYRATGSQWRALRALFTTDQKTSMSSTAFSLMSTNV